MKVCSTDVSFTDHSRGTRVTRWQIDIVLEGAILFSKVIEKYVPHSSGYADKDGRAENEKAAKKAVARMFAESLAGAGVR
jgi:hypothetical protein